MWRLEGVGCQLVLEGLQRCLAYCSLRELVPQDDSSWEKNSVYRCCLWSGFGESESRGL